MKGKEIRQVIIKLLEDKLKLHDFKLIEYKGSYAIFKFIYKDIVSYTFFIDFMKYGNMQFIINAEYFFLNKIYKKQTIVFNYNLNKKIKPNNDFYNRHGMGFPYSEKVREGIELDVVVEYIYKEFLNKFPTFFEKTNTIDKVDTLINNIDEMFKGSEKIKAYMHSLSYPHEVLFGTYFAIKNNNPNIGRIFDKYIDYCTYFEEKNGKDEVTQKTIELIKLFTK